MRESKPISHIVCALLLSQALWLVACTGANDDPSPVQSPEPSTTVSRKEVHSPIESAEIIVRESAPPQYVLRVLSGLPNGCARFSRIEQSRQGYVLEVTVWNSVPASDDVICTLVYGTADNSVVLVGEFEAGKSYEVRVNGESKTRFTAQ